jgi:DNA-3-methyladenine glycosylase
VQRLKKFEEDAITLANRLLGAQLVRIIDGQRLCGMIVEVEAYLGLVDKAAHTFNGRKTKRNASMYLPGGHAYVYMIYGIHHCLNIVAGAAGDGTAVLIRAIQPMEGLEVMYRHRTAGRTLRRALRDRDLCSGPGKLAQALQIDRALDGENLLSSQRLWIEIDESHSRASHEIVASPRIGVAYAEEWAEKPLRFFIAGNPHVSD